MTTENIVSVNLKKVENPIDKYGFKPMLSKEVRFDVFGKYGAELESKLQFSHLPVPNWFVPKPGNFIYKITVLNEDDVSDVFDGPECLKFFRGIFPEIPDYDEIMYVYLNAQMVNEVVIEGKTCNFFIHRHFKHAVCLANSSYYFRTFRRIEDVKEWAKD